MAQYDEERGNSRNVLLLVLLGAAIFGGGLYFWRSHSQGPAPVSQQTASNSTPERGTPETTSQPSCTRPTGAAGVFELHFDFDKSDIRANEMRWIEDAANAYTELAHQLADCPDTKLEAVVELDVVGHADTAGSRDYNQKLSERRAAEVTHQLERRGVPESQIRARGVGEGDLAVETPDNTPNAENRRAPITITIEAVRTGS